MAFKVVDVIDGDGFKVWPGRKWDDKTDREVRVNGYDSPEADQQGYQEAKDRVTDLILGNEVELKNPVGITYSRLLCDV